MNSGDWQFDKAKGNRRKLDRARLRGPGTNRETAERAPQRKDPNFGWAQRTFDNVKKKKKPYPVSFYGYALLHDAVLGQLPSKDWSIFDAFRSIHASAILLCAIAVDVCGRTTQSNAVRGWQMVVELVEQKLPHQKYWESLSNPRPA